MKKLLSLTIMFMFVSMSIAMEKFNSDEWEKVSDSEEIDWSDIRETICDHIKERYKGIQIGIGLSLDKAVEIVKIPQENFPQIACNIAGGEGDYFSNTFFDRLCKKSIGYCKARDIVISDNEKHLRSTVTGATIDIFDALAFPCMVTLCGSLREYLLKKMMEQLLETRSYILKGHTAKITGISMDHGIVASGSRDRTACIWNVYTGALLHTFEHKHPVTCVSVHPKKLMLMTTVQGKLHLWNLNTGDYITSTTHKTHRFNRAYFSEKGGQIIAYNVAKNEHLAEDQPLLIFTIDHHNKLTLHSAFYTPLSTSNHFAGCDYGLHKIMIDETNNNHVLLECETFIPYLCKHAYSNSQCDRKALKALLASDAFKNKLPVEDRGRFAQLIGETLSAITEQKKKEQERGSINEGIELLSLSGK